MAKVKNNGKKKKIRGKGFRFKRRESTGEAKEKRRIRHGKRRSNASRVELVGTLGSLGVENSCETEGKRERNCCLLKELLLFKARENQTKRKVVEGKTTNTPKEN